jgi:predicted enzyme related to lactoylglutathione lyase
MKKSPVVHFELPANDKARAAKFYQDAFGWETKEMGEEYGGYVLAMTTESDESGPKKPGAINGGIFLRDPKIPGQGSHIVVSVENIDEAIGAVMAAGGEVLGEKMNIQGVGTFVMIKDTEGTEVGVLEPEPQVASQTTA